jgi:hypothetical protein
MAFDINFSEKQSIAFDILNDPKTRAVLYGGAKGGGKTVFGCFWTFLKCVDIIKRFNLTPQQYPISVGYMGRKRAVDFNDTTLETWKRFIPADLYTIRAHEKEIIIQDTVKISYGGFDSEENIAKFNSAEFGFYFIDQAEEVSQDDIGTLRGTLRLTIDGQELHYVGLLTANPADCWLIDEFVPPQDDRYKYIQALPSDNPYLPAEYVENLTQAFKHRPELIQAYVYGRWDVLADGDLVIKSKWINDSIDNNIYVEGDPVVISCDPARFGDDETVIYALKGGKVIDEMIYGQKSTMETAGRCIVMKNKHDADIIVVDSTGIGSGVVDRLKELNQSVFDINFARSASNVEKEAKYLNMRAEMYFEAADLMAEGKVCIPNDLALKQQLGHIKYKTASKGRRQIESKKDVKKRMSGKSPDRADALIMGLWALQLIPKRQHDFKRNFINSDKGYNPLYAQSLMAISQGEYQRSDYEI